MDANQQSEHQIRVAEFSLEAEMFTAIRNSEPGKTMKAEDVLDTMVALRLHKA